MRSDDGINDDELRHSLRVRESIAREIAAAGGWISFERYMDLALYEPGLGYYSAGARKLWAGIRQRPGGKAMRLRESCGRLCRALAGA